MSDIPADHQLQPAETDTRVLAYTPEHYWPPYPWYLNLTMVRRGPPTGHAKRDTSGDVVITVRLPTKTEKDPREPGETASVRLTWDMWRQFVKEVEQADTVFAACHELDGML